MVFHGGWAKSEILHQLIVGSSHLQSFNHPWGAGFGNHPRYESYWLSPCSSTSGALLSPPALDRFLSQEKLATHVDWRMLEARGESDTLHQCFQTCSATASELSECALPGSDRSFHFFAAVQSHVFLKAPKTASIPGLLHWRTGALV